MNNNKRRVFLIDDEQDLREQLKLAFELSREYAYEVTAVASLEECIDADFLKEPFDIVIVDLALSGSGTPESEGLILLLSSDLREVEHRIVYTAHPKIENVVRAMKLGATDFISKVDCHTVQEFVKRVEATMRERTLRAEQQQTIREFLTVHVLDWISERPGQVLAIAVDTSTNKAEIVAHGGSRLEALVKYNQVRMSPDKLPHLPLVPHLHVVPSRMR